MSLATGKEAESKASSYLETLGYRILERNFHSKFGEIDIIALKDGILHFFEVKYSKDYDPLFRITPTKMAKLIKTIRFFFLKHPMSSDYQMDAIIVTPEKIEIIKNISY